MAKKRSGVVAQNTDTEIEASVLGAYTAEIRYEVALTRSIKIGSTWLRPSAQRVTVDAATLAELQEQNAVSSYSEVGAHPADVANA